MKTSIVAILICLLLASKMTGQTQKQIRDARLKPINDTAYVYIELKLKKKGNVMEIWQQDLQTGDRWYSVCPRDRKFPKGGSIVRMLRSKQEFID